MPTQFIDYLQGGTALRGFLAAPEDSGKKYSGILIAHDWMGVGEYVQMRAAQLAEMGYVAFAADIYGADAQPKSMQEAAQTAGLYKENQHLTRQRIQAALDVLREQPDVDPNRIAAIGYCFGGMVVLELARSGADIAGVVVFHGSLDTPTPDGARNIRAKVLALQGGDDPHVPITQTEAFMDEMRRAGVDWQLTLYGGAVHAFTNPEAGNDPSRGAAYNKDADRRSWIAMEIFLDEIFDA
jgi:dienelactone hydrolase